jgi:hypothetical protein
MAVVPRKVDNLILGACLAGDAVGAAVYVRDVFDPTDGAKMPAVGILVQKQSPTACIVLIRGFTPLYGSLVPGEAYVVGTDAQPAKIGDPTYPGAGGLIQQIGVATDDDEMLIEPQDVVGEGSGGNRYFQQSLVPSPDPKVFSTPIPFKHGGLETEVILYNGQRLREGVVHDYIVSESGGVGSGYDTITLTFTPAPDSNWFVDYVPDV